MTKIEPAPTPLVVSAQVIFYVHVKFIY